MPAPDFSKVPPGYFGFKTMLLGPTGTGKTRSIATLVDLGLEVFYLGLEPGVETLIGYFTDPVEFGGKNLPAPPPNLHWHNIKANTQDFGDMQKTADNIGKFDLSALTKMRDPNRAKNNQMVAVYSALNNFVDQRTGETFGAVDDWDYSRVIVIDGLSALSRIAMEMMTGAKPVRDKPDYGIAQSNLMSLLLKLTSGCLCHFVLIGHVVREVDEILGGIKLMPNTIGKAILADITQPFSDVILAVREANAWKWDTANTQADLKTRNLRVASNLPPSFEPLFTRWFSRAST